MVEAVTRGAAAAAFALHDAAEYADAALHEAVRRDRVVWVIVVIALAVIALVGLATAWWLACQAIGKYPAFSVPAWGAAGSYRAWCQ